MAAVGVECTVLQFIDTQRLIFGVFVAKAVSLGWILSLKGGAGVVSMELRSSQQRLTAASADRLCRRGERLEAVIAIADPSTMQPN